MYMVNGGDAQHKNALRLGNNVQGIGGPPTAAMASPTATGAFKMGETEVDASGFTEVLAVVNKPAAAWVKVRRKDGKAITANDAFAVGRRGRRGDCR